MRLLALSLGLGAVKVAIFFATIARLAHEHLAYGFCAGDCARFEAIARRGYADSSSLGQFPILPLVGGLLSRLTGQPFAPVVVVLNLALWPIIVALFIKWCEQLGIKRAWLPALLLTCDRYSLWSHVPYAETFFVLALLAFLLEARTGGVDGLRPAALAGLASGVRLSGLALAGGLVLGNLRAYSRRPVWGLVSLVVGLWGILIFFGYLQLAHGSWRAGIGAHPFSLVGFWTSLKVVFIRFYFPTVPLMIAGAWLLVRPPAALRFTAAERWTFCLLFVIPMAQTAQAPLTRHLTLLLPGYVGLAYAWERARERWRTPWLVWAPVVILLAEIAWQVILTRKFYLGEIFFWTA